MLKRPTQGFSRSVPATILSLFLLVFVLSTAIWATVMAKHGGDGDTMVTVNDGGTTLVVNVVLEQEYSNCPTGGFAVHSGIDGDANGLLEGDEIASTSYRCKGQDTALPTGILQGSYTIRNSSDASFISAITNITGDLRVEAPGLTSLALPALTSLRSDLTIYGNPALTSVYLPALKSVGEYLDIQNDAALTSVDLSALTSAGEDLNIYDNPTLCNALAIALRDQLNDAGWSGNVDISDNNDGC